MNATSADAVDTMILSAVEATDIYRSRHFWEQEFRRLGLWPELLYYDPISRELSHLMDEYFRGFQHVAVLRSDHSRVVGVAHSVPLFIDSDPDSLPETGWDWALETAVLQHEEGLKADSVCGLSISVFPEFQRRNVGKALIRAIASTAESAGLQHVVMPVRPVSKAAFPLLPMEQFMNLLREDGLHRDPWIRAHQECGGVIKKICHRSMTITAPISEWERWSGERFSQTERYVVKGCLAPVRIDIEDSTGVYEEPNIWVSHPR